MEAQTKIKNRLTNFFKENDRELLNVYFTAGFPALNDTVRIIKALQKGGADMVEIGIPFSDPLADGPVIQHSSEMALRNGMTVKILLNQLKDIRKEVTLPIMLMGYLNPVLQYGIEKFCRKASEIGIDGIILPDLPFQEFQERYKDLFEQYNLSNIFLITPNTSPQRVREIDNGSEGFIYAVSSNSTTGNTKSVLEAADYFTRIKSFALKNPFMIGFNIHDHKSFEFACQYANGAIIGSAFIKEINETEGLEKKIIDFIERIKNKKGH
jgi:tryptophan synthase alpha chain